MAADTQLHLLWGSGPPVGRWLLLGLAVALAAPWLELFTPNLQVRAVPHLRGEDVGRRSVVISPETHGTGPQGSHGINRIRKRILKERSKDLHFMVLPTTMAACLLELLPPGLTRTLLVAARLHLQDDAGSGLPSAAGTP